MDPLAIANANVGSVPAGTKPSCVALCNPEKLNPARYAVNQPGVMEMLSQPLYDIQTYPNTGATQFTFFQVPVGQSSKTLADTNMQVAGSLPNPQRFLIQALSIGYWPGITTGLPYTLGAAATTSAVNDMYKVFKAAVGYLSITIGSKNYLQLGPLDIFPPRSHFDVSAAVADATTAAAALNTAIQVPYITGPLLKINPIMLEPMQNWNVQLLFPTAVVLNTADAAAKIGIHLWGQLFRSVQ